VWDAKARKRTFQVEGKAGFPHSVGFSKDGSMLATIGGHGVMLWRSSGGTPVWKNETMRSPSAFAFSPEGKLVAVAQTYSEPSVRLLDGKTGKETRTLAEYSTTANSVDFSPVEPRLLLSSHGCGQGICVLHDVEKGVQRRSWPSFVSLSSEVGPKRNQPVFTPDGKYVAGFLSTGIALWDTGAGKNILRFAEGNDRVGCLAITVDGHRIAYPSDGKTTKICDMKTRRTLVEVKTNAWPLSLVFSPDGSLLASAPYRDRQVHLYDSKSGTEVRTLSLSGDPSCAAFSPDGRLIAGGGGAGGTLILWDLATGEAAHTLTHGRKVRCVAFTPDGRQLASGNEEGSIKLWDVKSGQNVCSLSEHRDNVLSLCFSSDGRLLASASSDGMIGVWKRGKQP
jgi:WD40 repeat protein